MRVQRLRIRAQHTAVRRGRLVPAAKQFKRLAETELIARIIERACRRLRNQGEGGLRAPLLQLEQAGTKQCERMGRIGGQDFCVQPSRVGEVACAVVLGRSLEQSVDYGLVPRIRQAGAPCGPILLLLVSIGMDTLDGSA
jgi:hypothetical protein